MSVPTERPWWRRRRRQWWGGGQRTLWVPLAVHAQGAPPAEGPAAGAAREAQNLEVHAEGMLHGCVLRGEVLP